MVRFIRSTGVSSWHFRDKTYEDFFGGLLRNSDHTIVQSFSFRVPKLFSEWKKLDASSMWSFECDNTSRSCFSDSFEGRV